VDVDLVDLDCLKNFWWSGAPFGKFVVVESLLNGLLKYN
jgi:hypothetical protein